MGYDLWAPSYGLRSNPIQLLESQALGEVLPELKDRTVLDLGCGRGRVARLALEQGASKSVGIDFSLPMIQAASYSGSSAQWLAGEALQLPLRRGLFDVVISALMMGHIRDL